MKTHRPRDSDSEFQRELRLSIQAAGGHVADLLREIPQLGTKRTLYTWLRKANPLAPNTLMQFGIVTVLQLYRRKKRTQARVARMELEG